MAAITPPRGMRDFLPAEKARRERALGVIRSVYRRHGFDEIETPVVEDTRRLLGGLGGDNEKLVFAVMKRGLTAADLTAAAAESDPLSLADLGLRFDLTVPLARFYATHRGVLPPVFRSIQIAPVWRAERPQKGRYRQFLQCDIDILGEAGPLAEVELITATLATLDALGINGCRIRVNDRRILQAVMEGWAVPEALRDRCLIVVDKLDKIGVTGVVTELAALGIGQPSIADDLERLANTGWQLPALGGGAVAAEQAYRDLVQLRDAVRSVAPEAVLDFDPTLVRGMGYYTGALFEIAHPDYGYSLGGGGRYDGMIGRFLGSDVPACGFSIGFERIIDAIDLDDGDASSDTALIYQPGIAVHQLTVLKQELIAAGSRVRLERRTKNTRGLLDRLQGDGFTRYAFVTESATGVADLEFRSLAASTKPGGDR